jgi:hypothetical protein
MILYLLYIFQYFSHHCLTPAAQFFCLNNPLLYQLRSVHFRVSRPLSERLSVVQEDNSGHTEEDIQSHICQDRGDESRLHTPRRDELRESVSPDIFVDRDIEEDGSCDRLIRIDGIGGRNSRKCCDLDSETSIANDDDDLIGISIAEGYRNSRIKSYLPVPMLLISNAYNNISNYHENYVWNHGPQSHLGLANSPVSYG